MNIFGKKKCGGSVHDGTGCKECAKCIKDMQLNFDAIRRQRDELRQRTHDIQRAESQRYGKLQRLLMDYIIQLSVGEGYVKRGQEWFWDEEKVAERPLHLSRVEAKHYGLLRGRVERAERALAALDKDGDLKKLAVQSYNDRIRTRGLLRMLKSNLWEMSRLREDSSRNRGKRDKMRRIFAKLDRMIVADGAKALNECHRIIKSVLGEIGEVW